MKILLEQEMYSCGTARANKKNWPTEFRKPTVFKLTGASPGKCSMKM
jgi:hypothetical protein